MFLKNKNSQIKLIYSLLILSISVSTFSQKPFRVGYINMDYILENFDDFKQANQEYSLKLDKWRREIERTQKDIEKKYDELEIKRPLLTTSIYNELKQEIDFEKSELEEYKQKRFGPEGDWIIQEKILIQPIQDEVLEAVQKIGDKNKFDIIFDKSSAIIMLYSEKKYDISELVLKSILRQEKIENLQINFDDEIKEKRRDSILKIRELKKISLQKKRDSIINARKNKK
jgi:Skp family chaperone for outer membrane proteins